jgi:hypothetical protein
MTGYNRPNQLAVNSRQPTTQARAAPLTSPTPSWMTNLLHQVSARRTRASETIPARRPPQARRAGRRDLRGDSACVLRAAAVWLRASVALLSSPAKLPLAARTSRCSTTRRLLDRGCQAAGPRIDDWEPPTIGDEVHVPLANTSRLAGRCRGHRAGLRPRRCDRRHRTPAGADDAGQDRPFSRDRSHNERDIHRLIPTSRRVRARGERSGPRGQASRREWLLRAVSSFLLPPRSVSQTIHRAQGATTGESSGARTVLRAAATRSSRLRPDR